MRRSRATPRLHRGPLVVRVVAVLAVAGLSLALPIGALAHPLGNFTINHYAGLTIARDGLQIDLVIDKAEIPAFQDRQSADTDEDGTVSDDEAAAWATSSCSDLVATLRIALDGRPIPVTVASHGVTFPPGAGGLSTLRLECGFDAPFAAPIDAATSLSFADGSFAERIGWREIVANGSGTIIDTHGLPTTSPSARLTAYPADLIAQPLDIRTATIDVRPDASTTVSPPSAAVPAAAGHGEVGPVATGPIEVASVAAVPGGVGAELPDIFRTRDVTPLVALVSIGTAIALGAGHAATPGHGKTLMAAYLVGSRGRAIHAVGLGLAVAVSHTLGIFVLALVIVGAEGVLAPETIARTTPAIAAVTIVAMGGWMLLGEVRRRLTARRTARLHSPVATSGPSDDPAARHDHDHADDHDHANDHDHGPAHDHEHAHDHGHEHARSNGPAPTNGHPHEDQDAAGFHSHGGRRHTHLPPSGATLSWRGLFVLGLAGGLIPSTSALLVLLASMASGRAVYGLVLVAAFGVGMAGVMTGVGVTMVLARGRLARLPGRSPLGRIAAQAPLLASVFVLGLGVVLTYSAVAGRPVL